MSMIYAMLNGDDDDYLRKPTPTRDRLLMIPGSGGASLPIRNDIFSLPKILAEHMYLLMADKGYEDPAKFRSAISNSIVSSLMSPTLVPQAVKPVLESAINYDFYQGKPIVGVYQKKEEVERQFNESTSELGKLLGKSGYISPLVADHLIRGFAGSTGGLFLYLTDPVLSAASGKPMPSRSFSDIVASAPGLSGFIEKSNESSLKHDFYQLQEETAKVANTMADIKKNSPEDLAEYLSDPVRMSRLELNTPVGKISTQLATIRNAIKQIDEMPANQMDADEKERQVKQLHNMEESLLKGLNIKALRQQAGL
jgi:hypothetical protein